MRGSRLLLVLALLSPAVFGTAPPSGEYRERRDALRKSLTDGMVILQGASEGDHGNLRSGFFQEANFYYLTGWAEPGAILVLLPAGKDTKPSDDGEILFIPKRNPEAEKWTGPKAAPGDPGIQELTGFQNVQPVESFEKRLFELLQSSAKVYTLVKEPGADKLERLLALRTVADAAPAISKLRMKKSDYELELIRRSTEITMDAHREAWKRTRPGQHEYQVAAGMSAVYFDRGCERHAYAPIVGSGPNAAILHYAKNSRRMDAGEVLLMDVGAECSAYAADITRTVPVDGKFTPRQREIYQIVLGAQKAAIAAVKPGMTLGKTSPNSLYKIAYDYIDSHGKDRQGNSLGRYFTHGLGHHVGLDVHDPVSPDEPLAPGMVITIEPGIYIPEESIGVRIEDMVLVTATGAKVLSEGLPRELADIEKALTK